MSPRPSKLLINHSYCSWCDNLGTVTPNTTSLTVEQAEAENTLANTVHQLEILVVK